MANLPADDPRIVAVAHSKFKIEWAKHHINSVKAIVDRIAADNTSVIRIENNFKPGQAAIAIGPKQHIPAELPLHVGDAVHALNSVWDFLWSGLARSINPTLASKVTAPRHETRQNLQADILNPKGRDAAIHEAFPQAKAFVLDAVKPYSPADGGSATWQIGRLDNTNKHRLLIMIPYVIAFDQDLVLAGADGGTVVLGKGSAIETQGHSLTIGLTPPVKIDNNPKATVTVVFRERDFSSPKPVVETLANFVEATTELIKAFEESFLV